ncbi:MAG: N-acetylmuramoyl-L-alanine amidase [Silanimonas sp.]
MSAASQQPSLGVGRGAARTHLAAAVFVAALLAACSSVPQRSPLATWSPSPNHDARQAQVIVLHHTQMASFEEALTTLKSANDHGRVSSHYLIAEDGRIVQLVDERARAWHAGAGRWAGMADLNDASIGIELDNDGVEPFAEAQIAALLRLLDDLCARLDIPRRAVIAHADLAPTRKADPSAQFPWGRLAAAGFGEWPRTDAPPAPDGFDPVLALALLGYEISDLPAAQAAFRRRFRGMESPPPEAAVADGTVTFDDEDRRLLFDLQQQRLGR